MLQARFQPAEYSKIAGALLCASLISACAPVFKPVLVQRDPPGPDLTDCPEEPPMPVMFPDEASRYQWSADAIFAGRECRAVLSKAKAWMLSPPKG